jgi:glucokinase
MAFYLGIEIGGTKLQLGLGQGDGPITTLWRSTVVPGAGAAGIRDQIAAGWPQLLAKAGITREQVRAAGIGFGGPIDTMTQRIIRSHQIAGWDDFPLADWAQQVLGLPTIMGNDADLAGLAEALFGAGAGLSPIFYITIGSGIGGGLIIDGRIYPSRSGAGRGAAEVGHLVLAAESDGRWERRTLEQWASGWALQQYARERLAAGVAPDSLLRGLPDPAAVTMQDIAAAAARGDALALAVLARGRPALADAICHIIALLCPRRILIGGGVSLIGEELFFAPLRQLVAERVFAPFAGLTEILPATLGENVVVSGALALARQRWEDTAE